MQIAGNGVQNFQNVTSTNGPQGIQNNGPEGVSDCKGCSKGDKKNEEDLLKRLVKMLQQLMQQQPNVAQAPAVPGEQPAQLPESPQAEGGETPPSMADLMGGAPATPPAESLPA